MRNKIIAITFAIYWTISIILLIIDFDIYALLFKLILVFPFTFAIVIRKHAFSLLILIMVCAFEIVMNTLTLFATLFSTEDYFDATTIVALIFFFGILFNCIKLLKDKPLLPIRFFITIGVSFFIVLIIREFYLYVEDVSYKTVLTLFTNMSLYGLIYTYVVFFDKKNSIIFN